VFTCFWYGRQSIIKRRTLSVIEVDAKFVQELLSIDGTRVVRIISVIIVTRCFKVIQQWYAVVKLFPQDGNVTYVTILLKQNS